MPNIKCVKCGRQVDESVTKCPFCGNQRTVTPQVDGGMTAADTSGKMLDIDYFSVPPKTLAILSVFTIGLYELYWHYQNWKRIKQAENTKIMPFWRAIFAIFFCYSLFNRMMESAKAKGFEVKYDARMLAGVYIFLLIVGGIWGDLDYISPGIDLLLLAVVSCTFIPLFFMQQAVEYNNKQHNAGRPSEHKYSGWEILLIVIGVLLFLMALAGIFLPE